MGDRRWLSVNTVYTYRDVYSRSIEQRQSSRLPFFLMESTYENEHGATTELLRTQAYHAVLSGATGHVFGNNPVWHFDGPGLFGDDLDWRHALGSAGARSMTHLHRLVARYSWWTLRPDAGHHFLTRGIGAGTERAAAAVADDGSLALIYVPTVRPLTLDLRQLAASDVTLTWYDPSNGRSSPGGESHVSAIGQLDVTPVSENAAGDRDWVLVMEAA